MSTFCVSFIRSIYSNFIFLDFRKAIPTHPTTMTLVRNSYTLGLATLMNIPHIKAGRRVVIIPDTLTMEEAMWLPTTATILNSQGLIQDPTRDLTPHQTSASRSGYLIK